MAGDKGVENSSEGGSQPSGGPAPVFISYASQDAETANTVCQSLESHGVSCWMAPRDVKAGAQYADAIVRAINEAKALVLVMSASAVSSAHVAREVERAASKRKPLIPFRIDTAALNPELEYFLSNSQWIDVPKLGIAAALARLEAAVGQGSAPSSQTVPPARRVVGVRKRVGIAAAVLVVAGIVAMVGLQYWSSSHKPAQPATVAMVNKSIAVLPFVDMSEKKDQEYFADGMAEEIIDLLVKVPGLKVISRTSSFQFKGKTEDLRSIGTRLGAAYVLEGSVRKSGDRMRVTAELIDSRAGTRRWSQTYDRDLSDVLKMQDEIARGVVRAVLNDSWASEVSGATSRNAEAYTAFLQGLQAGDRGDQQGSEQAVSDFQRALDLDPTFAGAASALAGEYLGLGNPEKARKAAERALKLDPNQSIAHSFLAQIHIVYDWDWAAAERELNLARALQPKDSVTWGTTALLSLTLGRWDDALMFVDKAMAMEPLTAGFYYQLSITQLRRGRLTEAEAAIRRAVELSPTYTFAQYILGLTLLTRSQHQAALAEFLKEPIEPARLIGSALAYFMLGRNSESDAALAQLIKGYAAYSPSGIASVYAFRGGSDETFKWLDRAYAQKDPLLYGIKYRTEFDKLHDDPRYKAFLKKMNLPE